MSRAKMQRLQRRGDVFYFRAAVPTEWRGAINCTEIKLTLKTTDRAVAALRCRHMSNAFDLFFGRYALLSKPSMQQLDAAVRAYFQGELNKALLISHDLPDDPALDLDAEIEGLRADIARLTGELKSKTFDPLTLAEADEIVQAQVAGEKVGKRVRKLFGGDWVVASAIVERMAAARNCRAADDLLMTVMSHPAYESDRLGLTYRTHRELMEIVASDGDLITRAVALTYLCGTDRFPIQTMRIRKGNYPYALEMMEQKGFPFCVLEIVRRGISRMREPLPIFVALLSRDVSRRQDGFQPTDKDDDIPPTTMIGEVPGWCIDWYTRPGRASLRGFLKRETPTGKWLKANVSPRDLAEVLGGLVFRVEGGLLRRRLQWPTGQHLRKVMETEAVGFGITDATEILALLRNDLPLLNEERRHVL